MSEIRLVSPLLDHFAAGKAISNHNGVRCYPAMRSDSEERFIVKTISIPASQVQLDALLLTGAYHTAEAARAYFKSLANGIRSEIEILDELSAQRGFLPYLSHQIVPMEDAVGYDVYLLSPYRMTLERYLRQQPLTHLAAVNMGIDLCAALTICRENGWLYVDLKPENIVLSDDETYQIADIGFVALNALAYTSLPDRCRSAYTAPEISDAFSTLNTTMDTYALGLILYQVFNEGKLPEAVQPGEAPAAPCHADGEMTEIILRAIAENPGDRWTDPIEMGKALIRYLQSNTVNKVPIGQVSEPEAAPEEPEDAAEPEAEAAEAESAAAPEEPETAEDTSDSSADAEASEETDVTESADEAEDEAASGDADAPAEEAAAAAENESGEADAEESSEEEAAEPEEAEPTESAEEPVDSEVPEPADKPDGSEESETAEDAPEGEDGEEPEADWITVLDSLMPADEDRDPDEPSLRDLLAGAELEADEDAPLTDEGAGILSQAQELIEHETPEPVVAPEPIEIPMPEPIVLEEEILDQEEPAGEEAKSGFHKIIFSDEDEEEEPEQAAPAVETPAPVKKHPGLGKKVLKIFVALAVLCALAAGALYYYTEIYQQTVNSLIVTGEADTMTVRVDTTADPSLLTVICKDTYGNAESAPLTDGTATFTKLKPASQYTVTLAIEGFHELVGLEPQTYSTPARTQVLNLTAITGPEDGSVLLNFAVEGPDSEEWSVSYQSESSEAQSMSFTGHTVTVTGLNIGETYTFTLSGGEAIYLIGESAIDYTVQDVVLAQNLVIDGYTDTTMTLSWQAPEGVEVTGWTAHCYNEAGFDQILQTDTDSVTFTEIDPASPYTVEITAQGMTQCARLFVTANPVTVTNIHTDVSGSSITLRWEFQGKAPEGGWVVLTTVDGSTEQQSFQTEEPALTIIPAAPGSHYDFVLQAADSTSVFGGTASADVPAYTGSFAALGLNRSNIRVNTYAAPEKDGWNRNDLGDSTTTFRPGSDMALLLRTTSIYQLSGKAYETLMVIRDSEGRLAAIDSSTRSWDDMWDHGYCELECRKLPAAPGSYTLEVYIAGGLLASIPITVSE